MITAAYVTTLAQYNAWQNNQLIAVVNAMDQAGLDADRGAFFGSIQATLSHLLWGDTLWLSRFDKGAPEPDCDGAQAPKRWSTKMEWATQRFVCDGQISRWARSLRQIDLSDTVTWTYSFERKQVTKPLGFAITHFFNHQTHHRGQVHAMLTGAGVDAPVSDLSYLPQDT